MSEADGNADEPGHDCCLSCGQPLGYWATDRLTGLNDRWGWDLNAPRAHFAARRSGRPVALLVVDVDHFKRINDEYGHPAGDAVLRELAEVLCRATRLTDLVSRYGGDEFLILAPGLDDGNALALAENIREGVRAMTTIAKATFDRTVTITGVTASLGIAAQQPQQDGALFDLMLHADTALRHAKRHGRDRLCLAPPHVG